MPRVISYVLSFETERTEDIFILSAPYDELISFLKMTRTGAGLAASENIQIEHLAEAIQYWSLDRKRVDLLSKIRKYNV